MSDLWRHLSRAQKPIVLYGMGDGADKVISALARFGLQAADFFASDGFVRGQYFHGKQVMSYAQVQQKYDDFIVLLSFATSRAEVIEQILSIAKERELYAPDVPVFGDQLFDGAFYEQHKSKIEQTRALLADERSKEIYDQVIEYKLTGKLAPLLQSACRAEEAEQLLRPEAYRVVCDLGAYTGDTARAYLARFPNVQRLYAFEPDAKNYEKLTAFAQSDPRVIPIQAAAWHSRQPLSFKGQGNRNSHLAPTAATGRQVQGEKVDNVSDQPIDFIKYDVEGSEKEALLGSERTIREDKPDLVVSLYHRSEDLFTLPLQIADMGTGYAYYLRRLPYIPAWDLNLYCIKE